MNELLDKLLNANVIYRSDNKYKRRSAWEERLKNLDIDFDDYVSKFDSSDEAWYCLLNEIKEPPKCALCNNKAKFAKGRGYNTVCSSCSPNAVPAKIKSINETKSTHTDERKTEIQEKRKKTCLKKYGEENVGKYGSPSFCALMEERYGDEHYNNREKCRETCLERYGVTTNLILDAKPKEAWAAHHDEILAKKRETCLKKFGAESSTQNKEIIEKIQAARAKSVHAVESANNCTMLKSLIKEYGQGWLSLNLPRIHIGGHSYISNEYLPKIKDYEGTPVIRISREEKDLVSFLQSLGFSVLENTKIPGTRLELDAYIPEKRIAFEFDGVYWHSSLFKPRNYHLEKTKLCEKNGIRLVHIFEDLWLNKRNIYESIIKSILGIYDYKVYARKCIIKEITNDECFTFLDNNHLQGGINSTKRLGLFYNDELLQIVCFGRNRFKSNEIELYRMCTKLNTQVVGGFSKLIKASGYNDFISYIDKSLYTGIGYEKSGFTSIGETPPGYFYCKIGSERLNRISCQKHKLSKLLKVFDTELTEEENMLANNYYKIYDCGNIKVRYKSEV